jgi:hypothetical protein
MSNSTINSIHFIDNPLIRGGADKYISIVIDGTRALQSWRQSIFSYEWLLPDGRIRNIDELPEAERPKRKAAEERINSKGPLEKPVLGIGMLDNIEIGIGRADFLTLVARGVQHIPVHIHKTNEIDFKAFRVDIA